MKRLSVVNEKPAVKRPEVRLAEGGRPYRFEPDLSTEKGRIEARVVEVIKTVRDPEIPVNIYELGLIYGVEVSDDGFVKVRMTLTAPNCPVAQSMPEEVRQKAASVEGARGAEVEIVWDPPWNPGMMSEAARLELNL